MTGISKDEGERRLYFRRDVERREDGGSRVYSAAGQECRMYLPDAKLVEVKKSKGGKVAFTQEADGAVVFPTSVGKSYRLRFE